MLRFPAKKIRAEVIKRYCDAASITGVVCCSSGNAAYALQVALGRDRVAPIIRPPVWLEPYTIAREFPGWLDATPGHLPMHLLHELGQAYKEHLDQAGIVLRDHGRVEVPTGSGETLVALATAYPLVGWDAVYNAEDPHTRYEPRAPLNGLVAALARIRHT